MSVPQVPPERPGGVSGSQRSCPRLDRRRGRRLRLVGPATVSGDRKRWQGGSQLQSIPVIDRTW